MPTGVYIRIKPITNDSNISGVIDLRRIT